MPALNFPNNPSLNQIYTANNTTWQWNGSSWVRSNSGIQGVQGLQGIQGIQGIQGVIGDTYWQQTLSGIHTTQNVGIATTTASSLYALDVHGDARITGILTVGSSSVIIDGNQNTVNVGSAVTIRQPNVYLGGQLEVAGIATFQNNVFINGAIVAGSGGGGATIGDDVVTRNLYASGVSTFVGPIAGSSASFTGDVTVGGVLKYEDVTNVDSVGIATARSGLRITDGGLDVVGIATFNNGVDGIDVIGHAELDQLRVSGVSTFTGNIDANGELDVDGHTELDNLNVSGIATIQNVDVQGEFNVYSGIATFYNNVYIGGNLSIGGTTTVISAQDLQIYDKDIILGVTTDANNNDVSNDTTANHGGIAIASTEGSPLVDLFIVGLETSPVTYKKLMWFREGSFSGLGTDAWLSNYAVGIGSTQVPNGVRLAAGGVQISDTTIDTTNLNVSGISTFVGVGTFQNNLFVGGTLYAPSLSITGGATLGDDLSTRNISASGIVTVTGATDLNGDLDVDGHTELDNVSISGVTTFVGVIDANGGLDVVGGSNFDSLNVSGVSTYTGDADFNGNINVDGHTELDNVNISGVTTFVGAIDANGDLDVDGHTELDNLNVSGISTFVGIVTTQDDIFAGNNLSVAGDARVVGILTVGSSSVTINGNTNTINVGTGVTIHTTTVSVNQLEVAGLSTFAGIGTFSSDLYVGGGLYATSLNIANGASLGEDITTRNISASGIVTVTGATDLNGDLDVDGHTELDNVRISGVLTATSAEFSGNVTVLGDLTYENVTNVDSVGIATARAGLRVTGGGLDVIGVSTFNNGANVASGNTYQINGVDILSASTLGSSVVNSSLTSVGTLTSLNVGGDLDVDGHAEFDNVNISGIVTASLFEGSSQIGIQSGGLQIGVGITTLNFVGAGNSILVNQSDPTIIDISIAGNTGAGGTWSSYVAGIATTKSVGINTDNLDNASLTGIGNSFQGLYISNGMIIHDNVLTGNHYIGTAFNGLMAGPVDVRGVLTIDGAWVVV